MNLYFHSNFSLHLHFDCDCNNLALPCVGLTKYRNVTAMDIPQEMKNKIFQCKSVGVYNKWHDKFSAFVEENKYTENFETVLIFFNEISKQYSPSTLWQAYSCLNKFYTIYKGWPSFNNTPILKEYIKKIEREGTPKKQAAILSKEHLLTFFETAPDDELKVLVRKAVAIIEYYGGLRVAELTALSFENVIFGQDSVEIFVMQSKTDPKGKSNFYFSIPKLQNEFCPYKIISFYIYKYIQVLYTYRIYIVLYNTSIIQISV